MEFKTSAGRNLFLSEKFPQTLRILGKTGIFEEIKAWFSVLEREECRKKNLKSKKSFCRTLRYGLIL